MEVPRLGVELELDLMAYATATAMPDLSHIFDLCHSSRQCRILNPRGRPGTEPASSWILVRFVTHWASTGTPYYLIGFGHQGSRTALAGWFHFSLSRGCRPAVGGGCYHPQTLLGPVSLFPWSLMGLLAGLCSSLAVGWNLQFPATWASLQGYWQHGSLLLPEWPSQAIERTHTQDGKPWSFKILDVMYCHLPRLIGHVEEAW